MFLNVCTDGTLAFTARQYPGSGIRLLVARWAHACYHLGATRNLREAILYSEAGERFALTLAYVLHELGALRVRRAAPSEA